MISFPFAHRVSRRFGIIHYPVVSIGIWSQKFRRWLPVEAVVDTGADYTLLPRFFLQSLGAKGLRGGTAIPSKGIGGSERVRFFPHWPLRLGPWNLSAPIGFLDRDDIPPLLGRMGCLNRFQVSFWRRRTTFAMPRPGKP